MIDKPSIINCGGVIFITTQFPHGQVSKLLPSRERQKEIGVEADLRATNDNNYFMVAMNRSVVASVSYPTPEEWNEKILQVVEHVWYEMVDRGIVNGTMPEIIKGNPLDMLPK